MAGSLKKNKICKTTRKSEEIYEDLQRLDREKSEARNGCYNLRRRKEPIPKSKHGLWSLRCFRFVGAIPKQPWINHSIKLKGTRLEQCASITWRRIQKDSFRTLTKGKRKEDGLPGLLGSKWDSNGRPNFLKVKYQEDKSRYHRGSQTGSVHWVETKVTQNRSAENGKRKVKIARREPPPVVQAQIARVWGQEGLWIHSNDWVGKISDQF